MTLLLQTLNQGTIEAGYFSIFTQQVRLGDFAIPTDEFCKFVAELATTNDSLGVQNTLGEYVTGKYDPQSKTVELGGVEVESQEFSLFADYVMHGGFMGWNINRPDYRPEFVLEAIQQVRDNYANAPPNSYIKNVEQNEFGDLEQKTLGGE